MTLSLYSSESNILVLERRFDPVRQGPGLSLCPVEGEPLDNLCGGFGRQHGRFARRRAGPSLLAQVRHCTQNEESLKFFMYRRRILCTLYGTVDF